MKADIYSTINAQIIAGLETGQQPWQKPWRDGASITRPLRASGTPYQGVNIILLWMAAMSKGYQNPTWMTYRMAAGFGGTVRKGETGTKFVYASTYTAGGGDDERTGSFLKAYTAFNVEQIDGLPERFTAPPAAALDPALRMERAERFFAATGARITASDRAAYNPVADFIAMPPFRDFTSPEAYYGTLAHEATHWTGAKTRLGRELTGRFGTASYAIEELVAEIGASFVCADLGVTPQARPEQVAYIASWLKILRRDSKAIFTAASMAGKAVEYLHGLQPKTAVDLGAEWKLAA